MNRSEIVVQVPCKDCEETGWKRDELGVSQLCPECGGWGFTQELRQGGEQ